MRLSKILMALVLVLMNFYSESQQVSGVVKDAATGKNLRGIRVTYKNISAAITDSSGAFVLKVPSPDVSIQLDGEGYQHKQIALKGNKKFTVYLYEDTYNSFFDLVNLPM